jgi:hypothetical protein
MILNRSWWILVVPIVILVFLMVTVIQKSRFSLYGSFLYFTAGTVSLSVELISFYIYQSLAGSLFSEMAVMIGTFMLGLAAGTYFASKAPGRLLERVTLLTLIAAILIFLATYSYIPYDMLLPVHLLFLLTAASATGSLFVCATARYYSGSLSANRGSGYAVELAGSSLGALFSMSLLLPVIGLNWLLLSLVLLIILAMAGSILTGRTG